MWCLGRVTYTQARQVHCSVVNCGNLYSVDNPFQNQAAPLSHEIEASYCNIYAVRFRDCIADHDK